MNRSRRVAWAAALVLVITGTWLCFPFLQGAGAAVRDHARGTRKLYALGCLVGPVEPSEPVAFRYQELLRQRHSFAFEGIGGFAPAESTVQYVKGYNLAAVVLVRGCPDSSFLKNTYDEAARDVTVRNVTFRGCLTEHELVLASGERLVVWAKQPITDSDLREHRMSAVVVEGKLTEVRAGEWNKRFGRHLEAQKITDDTGRRCSGEGRV